MIHIVGISGGIDSQACALWVRRQYAGERIILLNSTAGGNEHPITTAHLAWYSAQIHPVVTVEAKVKDLWRTEGFAETKGLDGEAVMSFVDLIKIKKRPPSRTQQFCTTFLKLWPQKRWIEENIKPWEEITRYAGVRRDESRARRDAAEEEHDEFFDCTLRRPIAKWSKQMCFDYCRDAGELVNPLYSMGFDRVGCAPCINSGKADIQNWARRSPEMIEKVRRWEKESGCTFFSPVVPGTKNNTIDQVVEWSMTTRGGKQFSLEIVMPLKACSSNWGLCE